MYGNNFFAVITVDTKEEVHSMYDAMKEGSTILVPLNSTTYSSGAFNLIDKFGVRWAVMTEQTDR